jgi:hypothetical protein
MITIKHIDSTCLQKESYIKLVKKYGKLKRDVLIIFDCRISNFGMYDYDSIKRQHVIKISPFKNKYYLIGTDGFKIKNPDEVSEKYNLIATTLHELYHAKQKEKLGPKFFNVKFNFVKEIYNDDVAEFWSQSEREARICENKLIVKAVEFYNKKCK